MPSPHSDLKRLALAALTAGTATAALAAPLDLSNVPLFAATSSPPPNILFVVDDSGSMDFEVLTQDTGNNSIFTGTQPDGSSPAGAGDVRHRDSDEDGSANCDFDSPSFGGYIYGVEFGSNTYPDNADDCNTADDQAWRFRNADFNALYYDPAVEYTPWAGHDINGNPFGDIDPTNAPDDPYNPSDFIDLTRENSDWTNPGHSTADRDGDGSPDGFRYYTWSDDNGDGLFDNGEQQEVLIRDLPATLAEDDAGWPNSQTNFANWFSYYRSRALTAKAAYGRVIAASENQNMGLVTLHNNNDVNTAIRFMNSDSASGNKRHLLQQLYSLRPGGGTPLRKTVYDAATYLACENNGDKAFSSCPGASEANGGACQQNFMVNMTDGFYNGSFSGLGNRDGDNNSDFDGGAYADSYSNTLGDIAMRFYESDIHTDYDNVMPTITGIDEADHQHITTYTVAFGVLGSLTGFPDNPTSAFTWPNPADSGAGKIDDLLHAAYNGRGLYLEARRPRELVQALSDAILSIGDRSSSAASVALNSSSLNSESHIYQARFDSADWSGQLISFPVSDDSGAGTCTGHGAGEICEPDWDAGQTLKGQDWDIDRRIITFNRNSNDGVALRWGDLNRDQKTDLKTHPDSTTRSAGGLSDAQGQRLLEYIRGRNYPDSGAVRQRSSPLGDIVNSDPFFVGAPKFGYDFGGYASFRATHGNRDGVVYVGANDGMLHAFDQDSGEELFAYLPADRHIWDNLTTLASTNYRNRHRYFVDGSPTAGDAEINGSWKTILVGGLGAGGQTLYALDITDPGGFSNETNAAGKVLWEFSDENDADLGFTFSQPSIVRMNNGKWAAVIGNGYNNTEADGHSSADGKASLFIIFLEGPDSGGNWVENTHYVKLEVSGGPGTPSPNGLSTPVAVDTNNDFDIDYIYAGDLGGNLWRFDVTDSSPANWAVGFNGSPLFIARDSGGNRQPITVRPEVGPHFRGVSEGLLVFLGTGRYIDASDNSSTGLQSFYGIWDPLNGTTVSNGRNDLVQQQIIEEDSDCSQDNPCFRVVTDNEVNLEAGADRGWFLDLVNTEGGNTDNQGERAVSNPLLRAGRIIFTTLIPSVSACEFGGDGWLMELDMFTGGRLSEPAFDTDNDGDIDHDDVISSNSIDIPPAGIQYGNGVLARPTILTIPSPGDGGKGREKKYASTSSGSIDTYTETGFADGRLSWRELR